MLWQNFVEKLKRPRAYLRRKITRFSFEQKMDAAERSRGDFLPFAHATRDATRGLLFYLSI